MGRTDAGTYLTVIFVDLKCEKLNGGEITSERRKRGSTNYKHANHVATNPYFSLFDDLNMTDTAVRKRHAGSLQPMKSTELQEEDDLKKVISSKPNPHLSAYAF